MRFDYLCQNHRNWLIDNPVAAARTYSNHLETGRIFYEQHQWHTALPYLGSAYDIGFILSYYQNSDIESRGNQFAFAGYLLADALSQCQHYARAIELTNNTEAGLQALAQLHPYCDEFGALLHASQRQRRHLETITGPAPHRFGAQAHNIDER